MDSIFPKLFELLPSAEDLLNLEPEELAAPLLMSLESSQTVTPETIISHERMKYAIHGDLEQKYPYKSRDEVLFALMEAWQWLEREGFVAPRPTNLVGSTTVAYTTQYFVTRRGQRVETPEALASYRKSDLLPKRQLHPIIAQKVWSIFLQGDYDTAVFQAFKQVEIAVRDAGSYEATDYGTDLMRKAFHVDNGILTDQNQPRSERQSCSDLFAGAIGYCKNPGSHREVDITAQEAVKLITMASYFLGIVDSRKQPEEG